MIEIVKLAYEPTRAHWPEGKGGTALFSCSHRLGVSPKIAVVVADKAGSAVEIQSGLFSVAAYVFNESSETFRAGQKIADARGPIVHLGVDIYRVVGAPGREGILIEKPLKVNCRAFFSGGADHQVSTEIKEQLCESGIIGGVG